MNSKGTIEIRNKALKSIIGRHPWVFSGALKDIPDNLTIGDVVDLIDENGNFLGRGFFNPNSQIAVRILSFDESEFNLDEVHRRIGRAVEMRKLLPEYDQNSAWRLVFGESDLLPGLAVDYYSGFVNVQFHSAGWDRHRDEVASMIVELTNCSGVFDGSDSEMRDREGLLTINETVRGDDPPDRVSVSEFGRKMDVDIRRGQKSGLYLDQKFNHQSILRYARNRDVLDCFSYTGGFGLAALEGGCRSLSCIDISESAIEQLEINAVMNNFASRSIELHNGDAFEIMRDMLSVGSRFDLITLDPPAFCRSKSAVVQACRGYKDINRLAMQLLNPEGILVSCSCSRPVSDELFLKVLWQASVEADREAQLLNFSGQAPDHPVLLTFPESKYLKCATLSVM